MQSILEIIVPLLNKFEVALGKCDAITILKLFQAQLVCSKILIEICFNSMFHLIYLETIYDTIQYDIFFQKADVVI